MSADESVVADERLVAEFLARRDEAAFVRLYRRHTPFLLALSRRLLQASAAAVDDVVQETWIRAVLALPGFRWESRLRTWLASIAVNCCREQRRRVVRRREEDPVDDLPPSPPSGLEPLDLERAIGALPDELRDVLVLYALAGHTHDEVAELLGIAPGTSKSRLFQARRRLRARLGGAAKGVAGR